MECEYFHFGAKYNTWHHTVLTVTVGSVVFFSVSDDSTNNNFCSNEEDHTGIIHVK